MAQREGGGNTVLANLPVPKLNEVYYWEAKMYEKPPGTDVVIGLATKPFPSFRMPGHAKVSVGYCSTDGFRCHNFPFTASSYGPPLAEGDVLGVGYRPRNGTVFFTRNGKKLEDCYTGLSGLNMFPAVGANGAATVHINLGQAGFVFIEANVKKWGLAPMMGTLAPPPAYGSERGSILLDAGYGTPGANNLTPESMAGVLSAARRLISENQSPAEASTASSGRRNSHGVSSSAGRPIPGSGWQQGHRRGASQPVVPSPLRLGSLPIRGGGASSSHDRSSPSNGSTQRLTVGGGSGAHGSPHTRTPRYHSPTDRQVGDSGLNRNFPDANLLEQGRVGSPYHDTQVVNEEDEDADDTSVTTGTTTSTSTDDTVSAGEEGGDDDGQGIQEESPLMPDNPPTPNQLDISLRSLHRHSSSAEFFGGRVGRNHWQSDPQDHGNDQQAIALHDQTSESEADRQARRERRRQRRQARRAAQLASNGQDGLQARLNALVQGVMPGATHGGGDGHAAYASTSDVPPPGYAPLDPYRYAEGVPTDLPAEIISQAFEE